MTLSRANFKEQFNNGCMYAKMIDICYKAHKDQMYGGDDPYTVHLEEVVEETLKIVDSDPDDTYKIVAMGHDLIEDTDWCVKDLLLAGFDDAVVDAIDCISKKKGQGYNEYIKTVKSNDVALVVKRADTMSNLKRSFEDQDHRRIKKYARQLERLYKE